jgi:hypothetical protein
MVLTTRCHSGGCTTAACSTAVAIVRIPLLEGQPRVESADRTGTQERASETLPGYCLTILREWVEIPLGWVALPDAALEPEPLAEALLRL